MPVLLLLSSLLTPGAFAASPFYSQDTVAAESALFGRAAEHMGPAFEGAQSELARMAKATEALDKGVSLMGDRAPADFRSWAGTQRKQLTGQYLQLQRHVDLLQADYGEVFGAAMERARLKVPGAADARECQQGGMAAMMGKKGCEGQDLSSALAKAMDKDPELARAVSAIEAVPWPKVGLESQTWAPAGESAQWVMLSVLAERYLSERMASHADDLDRSLAPLMDGLDAGDAAAVEQARALREAYERAVAADGQILTEAVGSALGRAAKKGDSSAISYCLNPSALGGCSGEDLTRKVVGILDADKKFMKTLDGLR